MILFFIVLLAIFFRFHGISDVPPSVSLDEASIGYNAYSILKTGGDEFGNRFPLLLRAFDDWRPALYVYLVIPFVKLFGLTALAVRLPSIILSVLTVLSTYFLVKNLLPNVKKLSLFKKEFSVGEISAFLLAISPWHIYISRLGHEANAGLAFFVFGLLFFIKKRIYFSFIFFSLSFMSYQSEKVFIPLFLLILSFFFRKEVWKLKKIFLFASLIALVIVVPFIKESLSPNALIRAKATSILTANQETFYKEAVLNDRSIKSNDIIGKIVHNRRIVALRLVSLGYFSHFNLSWLFANSSADRHKVPNLGLLYPWELPLIFAGLIFLTNKKIDGKIKGVILSWIIISPLSGAITTDAPHAMRTYTFLPAFQILSALGFIFILNLLKNKILQKACILLFLLTFLVSSIYLYNQYFLVFPKTQSSSFQYALSKALLFVNKNESNYNKIIFSNKESLYQSYMFFLFYNKYDPSIYQKNGGTKSGGFAESHSFSKYEFRPIDWLREKKDGKSLYIGNINEFSSNVSPLAVFSELNGKESVKIIKNEE